MLPEQARFMSKLNAPKYSLFFLLMTSDGPVRAWLGFGDYYIAPNEVDVEGGIYLGIGLVGQIPPLRQLIGGVAERREFQLNGADEETFRLADRDADTIRNAPVHVGIVFFDDHWQAADDIFWPWTGTADVIETTRDGAGDAVTRSVRLSVASGFTDRRRPQLGFYTDADQRRRSPDDAFCSRVAAMSVDSTITWPAPG